MYFIVFDIKFCTKCQSFIFLFQGHINDTIVVNQPRLTTDEDHEIITERDVDIEMTIVDDNGLSHHEGVLEEVSKIRLSCVNLKRKLR